MLQKLSSSLSLKQNKLAPLTMRNFSEPSLTHQIKERVQKCWTHW